MQSCNIGSYFALHADIHGSRSEILCDLDNQNAIFFAILQLFFVQNSNAEVIKSKLRFLKGSYMTIRSRIDEASFDHGDLPGCWDCLIKFYVVWNFEIISGVPFITIVFPTSVLVTKQKHIKNANQTKFLCICMFRLFWMHIKLNYTIYCTCNEMFSSNAMSCLLSQWIIQFRKL